MIEDKLQSLGITLPIPPKPAGSYIPILATGNLVFVSGQIPIKNGELLYKGKVPKEISIMDAQQAARLCIINALAHVKSELGALDKIEKIVKVCGFVNSSPEFTEQPKILNAASDLLYEIFGNNGKHTRIAVGVASLPLGAAVEIDMTLTIS